MTRRPKPRRSPAPHRGEGAAARDADHQPAPVDMACESVAGEEDPGASIDLAVDPAAADPDTESPPR